MCQRWSQPTSAPSRTATLYPFTTTGNCPGRQPVNATRLLANPSIRERLRIMLRTGDRAGDPGDDQAGITYDNEYQGGGPPSYSEGDRSWPWPPYSDPNQPEYFQSGVSFIRSQVTMAQIERGTAHIIYSGQKYWIRSITRMDKNSQTTKSCSLARTTTSSAQPITRRTRTNTGIPPGLISAAPSGRLQFLGRRRIGPFRLLSGEPDDIPSLRNS